MFIPYNFFPNRDILKPQYLGLLQNSNCLRFLSFLSPGVYLCTAFNGVGEAAVSRVTLNIEYPPTIDVPKPRVAQAQGYDAELTCTIRADPAPVIRWMFGNETISPNNHDMYRASHFAKGEKGLMESTLTVRLLSE